MAGLLIFCWRCHIMSARTMAIRIDQWLWAARLFKTRSLANQACRGGRVQVTGKAVKPAHPVRTGEVVSIKQPPIVRQYLVKNLAVKRVSAALSRELIEEITPAADLEKLAQARRDPLSLIFATRGKGSGRPTKKERRHLEKLIDPTPENNDDDSP
jgi:ribosome-associated heat shock protein Hsp15